MLGISTSNLRVGGFRGKGIDADAVALYSRIIADGGVSNLTRLNYFVKGLKTIYGSLANVPVCYDAHWIGYKLGSGTGATAGQAAAKLYSLTVAGDAIQTTAASQPLLLAHNGASSDNYWYGSGATGNYVSTPSVTANQITGDIEIIIKASCSNVAGSNFILAKDGATRNYAVAIAANVLYFGLNYGAGLVYTSFSAGLTDNVLFYIKVNRVQSTGVNSLYKSTDGITYTLLGQTTQSTSPIITSAIPLTISSQDAGAGAFQGKIYRATISNSIGGSPVVDFNPATYNASTSQTAWTSATGEIWTINTGTATSGYKGTLVSRTIVQGDGTDDTMETDNSLWGGISSVYSAITYININIKTGTSVDSNIANIAIQKYEGIDAASVYFVYQGGLNISKNANARNNLNTLYNSIRNGASSALNFNNGTDTTGTMNTAIATGVRILSSRTSAAYTNGNLNTILISGSADSGATRTATYNLIRSLNNNAF